MQEPVFACDVPRRRAPGVHAAAWLPDHILVHHLGRRLCASEPGGLIRGTLLHGDAAQVVLTDTPSHLSPWRHPVITGAGQEIWARIALGPPTAPSHAAEVGPSVHQPAGFLVYGTLRNGQSNAKVLTPHGVLSRQLTRVSGQMWDFGPWPGVRFDDAGDEQITGELVVVSSLSPAIADLDALEGFPGWMTPGGAYRRTLVPAASQLWWTYQIQDTVRGRRLRSGDWCAHR